MQFASLLLLLAGCGGGAAGAEAGRPTVFAAASLTESFPRIDSRARFSFGGSNDLAAQIRAGAPADVFASASPRYADELHADGLVEPPRTFALNRIVVIVPAANPAGIQAARDVARPGVRLVLAAEGVPAGDYAREALAALGIRAAALANVASNEADVKGVVGKVALGEADAGLVYATDATPVRDEVRVVELPDGVQPPIRYEIAVLRDAPHFDAAEAFVERVLGPEGRRELERAGFLVP